MTPDFRQIVRMALIHNGLNPHSFGRMGDEDRNRREKRSNVVCWNFLYLYLSGAQEMNTNMMEALLRELGVEIHIEFNPTRWNKNTEKGKPHKYSKKSRRRKKEPTLKASPVLDSASVWKSVQTEHQSALAGWTDDNTSPSNPDTPRPPCTDCQDDTLPAHQQTQ